MRSRDLCAQRVEDRGGLHSQVHTLSELKPPAAALALCVRVSVHAPARVRFHVLLVWVCVRARRVHA